VVFSLRSSPPPPSPFSRLNQGPSFQRRPAGSRTLCQLTSFFPSYTFVLWLTRSGESVKLLIDIILIVGYPAKHSTRYEERRFNGKAPLGKIWYRLRTVPCRVLCPSLKLRFTPSPAQFGQAVLFPPSFFLEFRLFFPAFPWLTTNRVFPFFMMNPRC